MVSLARALEPGDEVILSTGAVAVVRKSYPKGYRGRVEFELDGRVESDEVESLTLEDVAEPPETKSSTEAPETGLAQEDEASNARAPSVRMED